MLDTYLSAAQLREVAAQGVDTRVFHAASGRCWVNVVTKDHPDTLLAEMHEHEVDIYLVLEGEATLLLGGTLVHPSTPSPGQHRGDGLDGAREQPIRAGDLVAIPEGTPHLVDARGHRLVYLVVKCVTGAG